MSGSKGRIFAFFQQFYSDRERVDFLKQEYGTGGRSHALSNADGSDESHSGKGIRTESGNVQRCISPGKKSPDESPD